MFQPTLRAFDGAGAAALAGPYSSRAIARPRSPRFDLDDLDLIVDLGDRIGSLHWWRGIATVTLLCTAAIVVGTRPVSLPTATPPALLPSQVALAAPAAIAPLALGGTTGQTPVANNKVRRLAEAPERPRVEVQARMRGSDSLGGALKRAGVGAAEARQVADMVGSSAKGIKPGTAFDLVLGRRDSKAVPRPLEHLAFRAAFDMKMEVVREGDALQVKRIPIKVDNTPLHVEGKVGRSLQSAARAAGMPGGVVGDFIKALSYSVDIQREVKAKDRFDIVVSHRRAETGETETGQLLYAALNHGGKRIELMRWGAQFFNADGSSAKKGLMRTPVNGARQTSGFGFRLHPLLGYSRMHKGTDFGAPMGSPILASAAGTVSFAGWHGGHGNYVMIQHGRGIATAYAHMSKFAVKPGSHVNQGQVIGYVGSTGMSTGPHLHYEVWVNGQAVNPTGAKFQTGTQLAGSDLAKFRSKMAQLRGIRASENGDGDD